MSYCYGDVLFAPIPNFHKDRWNTCIVNVNWQMPFPNSHPTEHCWVPVQQPGTKLIYLGIMVGRCYFYDSKTSCNVPVQYVYSSRNSDSPPARRSGDRTPLEARDFVFFIPVLTGPGAHTATCTMGTVISSPKVKRQSGALRPTPSGDEGKNE